MTYQQIISFWFEEIKPHQRFIKDLAFDQMLTSRFAIIHQMASKCELSHWRSSIEGRLAEIIVLDQFSRNIYRDKPEAFACDSLALALAQEAITTELHHSLPTDRKAFLYMPFMHSESKVIHQTAVTLFSEQGLEFNLDYEVKHKAIIDRFGRYPHRNQVLGRSSTKEEIEFLKQPGSSF